MHRSVRNVLSKNLQALMACHRDSLGTEKALRGASGIGGGTFTGVVNGTMNTSIDTLEKLAKAFKLQPWQLLVPDLDPRNPPIVKLTDAERQFYERIHQQFTQLQETMAEYAAKRSRDP